MTCEPCSIAASNPRTGLYRVGCRDCGARALAQSSDYFTASASARITAPYKAALATIQAPDETVEAAHKRVREWDQRIRATAPAGAFPTAQEK